MCSFFRHSFFAARVVFLHLAIRLNARRSHGEIANMPTSASDLDNPRVTLRRSYLSRGSN